MKYQAYLTLFSFIAFFLNSCSDKNEPHPIESSSEFINLEVGNYWTYDWYIENNEGSMKYHLSDSVYISSKETLDGKVVFKKVGTFLGHNQIQYIFDSLNTLYSFPDRTVIFSLEPTTFESYLANDLLIEFQLEELIQDIDVPIGSYECLNFKGEVNHPDYGTLYNNNYYSRDIGLVKMTTHYYHNQQLLEMILTGYGSTNKPG
ncbi:MAG: hypothetical protein RIC35_21535 [Marinoscillum sp.]